MPPIFPLTLIPPSLEESNHMSSGHPLMHSISYPNILIVAFLSGKSSISITIDDRDNSLARSSSMHQTRGHGCSGTKNKEIPSQYKRHRIQELVLKTASQPEPKYQTPNSFATPPCHAGRFSLHPAASYARDHRLANLCALSVIKALVFKFLLAVVAIPFRY